MMDYVIMCLIAGFMALSMLYKAKVNNDDDHFFDIKNTNAMRGFWCLVVMMVHVPLQYQNRIQDMIGSFAYIGVTFFFMTSGYGLTISADRKGVKGFWKKRMMKLLTTIWVVNIFASMYYHFVQGNPISIRNILLSWGGWIEWLMGCYVLFWISYMLFNSFHVWKQVCCILLALSSMTVYYLSYIDVITATVWVTECYGFMWGILLATYRDKFIKFFSKRWIVCLLSSMSVAVLLGFGYLNLKSILFWGEYVLKIVLSAAITIFILIVNVRVSFNNKINKILGELSFEIYLIHGIAFSIVMRVCNGITSGLFIVLSIILSLVLAITIHVIDRKLFSVEHRLFESRRTI